MAFWRKTRDKKEELIPPIAIGERFKYLGVTMICTRHRIYHIPFPVIAADYVTLEGEIKDIVFMPIDWKTLEAENKTNDK